MCIYFSCEKTLVKPFALTLLFKVNGRNGRMICLWKRKHLENGIDRIERLAIK